MTYSYESVMACTHMDQSWPTRTNKLWHTRMNEIAIHIWMGHETYTRRSTKGELRMNESWHTRINDSFIYMTYE